VVHAWAQDYLRGPVHGRDLAQVYATQFPEGAQDERLRYENIQGVLRAVETQRAYQRWPWQQVYCTEESFRLSMGKDLEFFGRIDGVVGNPDGTVDVLEIKTTGHIDGLWESQWQTSGQLMGYVWAAQQLWSAHAIRGCYVWGIELRRLPPWNGELRTRCSAHKVAYAECQMLHAKQVVLGPIRFTTSQMMAWERTLRSQARVQQHLQAAGGPEAVQSLPMQGMFFYHNRGNLCTSCEFKNFCYHTERTVAAMEQFLEARPSPEKPGGRR